MSEKIFEKIFSDENLKKEKIELDSKDFKKLKEELDNTIQKAFSIIENKKSEDNSNKSLKELREELIEKKLEEKNN